MSSSKISSTKMAMASKTRTGIRAITMQQPYAAALCAGVCRHTRRGKSITFTPEEGEWIAVHVGSNNEHLKNINAMHEIRQYWPDCPSDIELKSSQKHILGFVKFINGSVGIHEKGSHNTCVFMQQYKCNKPYLWQTSDNYTITNPISYPKGQLQLWHLYDECFENSNESGGSFFKMITSDIIRQSIEKQIQNKYIEPSLALYNTTKIKSNANKAVKDEDVEVEIKAEDGVDKKKRKLKR